MSTTPPSSDKARPLVYLAAKGWVWKNSSEMATLLSPPTILDERYPARRVLNLVADKWTPVVLFCLSGGIKRFGELQHHIPDISKKMLTQVLRHLERDGLVKRTVYPVVPPKTEYVLTALGRRIHEPVAMLCRWAMQNTDVLEMVSRQRRRNSGKS